jgi:hypothetical protein
MATKGKVIVFGILFGCPLAGIMYQFLHYLLGLRRLGYDPYYVEDSSRWIYDPARGEPSWDPSGNIASVLPALEAHGFQDRWCFRGKYEEGRCYGMTEAQLEQLYRDADAFLNVTSSQEIREEHMVVPRRIFVESDPFPLQAQVVMGETGPIAQLEKHNAMFTFGENIGAEDCAVPVSRHRWLPTRQPVALDLWDPLPAPAAPTNPYNTITTWHNKGKDITYQGDTYYWTKDREFEKFLDLPQRRPAIPFELATDVLEDVRQRLLAHGWRHRKAAEVSRDLHRYRDYIRNARGEFTIARDQYVRPRTGWFSDRTCCYLAAGRPVITQETGFSKFLPCGKGLYAFTTMADVLAAVDAIETDYPGNCRAAREIAQEYFETTKVVGSLMERAGL